MGPRAALTPGPWRRDAARTAVGWAAVAWGAAILLSTLLSGGVPPREALERTRGTVETLEAGRGALHFTLAGQAPRLRYLGRGGDIDGVRRLLDEARTRQVLLLFEPSGGVVYEVEGESGARRYEQVRDAWRDKSGTDVGLGLALMFVGARLALGRPREGGAA